MGTLFSTQKESSHEAVFALGVAFPTKGMIDDFFPNTEVLISFAAPHGRIPKTVSI